MDNWRVYGSYEDDDDAHAHHYHINAKACDQMWSVCITAMQIGSVDQIFKTHIRVHL